MFPNKLISSNLVRKVCTRAWRIVLLLPLLAVSHAHALSYVVSTTADGGAGSLRQAITDANAIVSSDIIVFLLPANSVITLLPGHDQDTLGLGFTQIDFSSALSSSTGQTNENAVELFYKARVREWISIQPDLQYIARPNGIERDALVTGLRCEVAF